MRPVIPATVALSFWVSHSSSGNRKNVKYVRVTEDGSGAEGTPSNFAFPSYLFLAEAHVSDIKKAEGQGVIRRENVLEQLQGEL